MKNQFKPYKDEAAGGYLYGVLHPEIVVLPLGIIWDLIEAWDNVKKSYDKNLSFSKAIKLFQDCYELESHCEISIENGYGDDQFSLPDTYSTDTEFCNANRLMEEYLTDDFLDKFVEQSYTGYLDDIIIIDEKNESKIVEYFESENIKIIRDDKLMNETLNPDWFHKMKMEQMKNFIKDIGSLMKLKKSKE